MNEANRIIVMVALTCVAFAGLCLMVSATLQPRQPCPMVEGYEIIFVPAYEECPPEERVLLDMPIKVVDSTGKVRIHWIYECRDTARNRASPCVPNIATDMTQMPDYENPE